MASPTNQTPQKRVVARKAYQMEEKDGGFQLFCLLLDDKNVVVGREKVDSPDAWDQTILLLESELSRQFQ